MQMGSRFYVVSVLTIVVLLCLLPLARDRILFWNIPDNFRGWAIVTFDDQTCEKRVPHSFWKTIAVDQTGKGCAPFSLPRGWTFNRYAYVKADGTRISLSARSQGNTVLPLSYNPSRKTYVFFVGTETERDKSWNSEPRPL